MLVRACACKNICACVHACVCIITYDTCLCFANYPPKMPACVTYVRICRVDHDPDT